jgi:fructose-1,6-bisphosphatase/inositol monophosphatase family enzyme
MPTPDADGVLDLFAEVVAAVAEALAGTGDWGLTGGIPGQHHSDLAADRAALEVLAGHGVAVLSEESGRTLDAGAGRGVTVVVDPLDGSTNAAHGIPWYATSLCAVDAEGPWVAMVANQAGGSVFTAVRGRGAWCDGTSIAPTGVTSFGDAVVGLSGFPARWLGWRQYRALGAAALDLCLVASGGLDAYIDCSRDAHGPWDYLGGLLVCREAGAAVAEVADRDLVVLEHDARRTPIAAATPTLLDEILVQRRASDALP